jgi:hypothetical protein
VEKTAEMTFAEALSSVDSKKTKLASAFKDLPIEELEELIKKEASPKKEKKSDMVKMSAEEKFALADQWGRDLARDFAKTAGSKMDALKGAAGAVKGHVAKHSGKYGLGAGYLGGVQAGRHSERWLQNMGKEKKSLALPPGVSGLLGKAMPTVTKGLQSAGKAMAGSSMLGRAAGGAAIGAVGGAAQKPGINPMTGQSGSRLGGALRGAAAGGVAGAAAPALVGGAQKLVGRMAPAVGK